MSEAKRTTLKDTMNEARRFLDAAEAAARGFTKHPYSTWDGRPARKGFYWTHDGVTYAAAKRASMDLTRALARMRRSQP